MWKFKASDYSLYYWWENINTLWKYLNVSCITEPGGQQWISFTFVDLLILSLAHFWQKQKLNKYPDSSNTYSTSGFPGCSDSKESACNDGDLGLILVLGRSSGGGNPLQYSCLKNPHGQRSLAGYTVHGVAKGQTWLSNRAHSTYSTLMS